MLRVPLFQGLAHIYVPKTKRMGGHIAFGVDPVSVSVGVSFGVSIGVGVRIDSFPRIIFWTVWWILTKLA